MKLLIETTLADLYLLLIDDKHQIIDRTLLVNLVKKSDCLASEVANILQRNQARVDQIHEIFVTKGPGSFMGVRAGLLFANTLAFLLGAKLKTCSSLLFIQKQPTDSVYYDARGNYSYQLANGAIKLVPWQSNYQFSYQDIEQNIDTYLAKFKSENPLLVEPLYVKEPQIG